MKQQQMTLSSAWPLGLTRCLKPPTQELWLHSQLPLSDKT